MSALADAVEVSAPTREELSLIGPLLAGAFLDDPVWTAIGPRRRAYRALTNRASFWGIVNASARHGARMRVARLNGAGGVGGRLLGATIAFEPGRWPPPERAAVWELGWATLAGPAPVLRGVRVEREMRSAHVAHPHMYLWYIGVDPEVHGRGVGRALMADLHERSDELSVPTYLETGTESNVGFYRSLGYEPEGELNAGDVRLWPMQRPAGGELSAASSP